MGIGGALATVGTIYDDVQCAITIPGLDATAVRVASYGGTEKISTLFRYWVDVATSPDDVSKLEDALGKDVSFATQRNGAFERGVHGILTEVAPDGAYVAKNWVRTRLLVQPRLANLRYSGGFRIFQKQSVKDIIEALVKPERIEIVWRLRPDPPVRDYRTQLNESDFAFLERLAADEGLTFFFESTKDKTTLVFTNSPKGFLAIDGAASISFFDIGGTTHSEHVRTIQREARVRTGAVEHRDYDFTNPRVALVARSETTGAQSEANTTRREWRDYPGGFTDPDGEGKPRATMRLEELRADAKIVEGTASSQRLVAGKKFTLTGHNDAGFNGDLIVTNVTVGGGIPGAFDEGTGGSSSKASSALARFTAVPADVPLRPKRLPKPGSRLQTARVVGPAEGDPNVDKFGRINVQFMWDRDGKFDAHSSCWIRMATPNAHANEGFWTAHRVGSEVLVDFIDGDIDRPVVVGALYNGRETQPYAQPGGQTRSTWKVRGIPGGSGYNEITFENSSGSEQIILHAQKDMNETILNDHTESVGNDQTDHVAHDQLITVGNDRTRTVKNNESIDVTVNQKIHVGGDQTTNVDGNQSNTIGVNQTDSVGSARSTTVGANDSTTVGGDAKRMVAGSDTLLIEGSRTLGVLGSEKIGIAASRTIVVGGGQSTNIVGDRSASMTGDETISVGGKRASSVKADDATTVGAKYGVNAVEECLLQVGDASLTITKDGKIVLTTGDSTVSLAKDGTLSVKGKNVTVEASSAMQVKGDSVVVKGSKVGIN